MGSALAYRHDFLAASSVASSRSRVGVMSMRWKFLEGGRLKLNIGASLRVGSGASIGGFFVMQKVGLSSVFVKDV